MDLIDTFLGEGGGCLEGVVNVEIAHNVVAVIKVREELIILDEKNTVWII